jgi:hypothetical protein
MRFYYRVYYKYNKKAIDDFIWYLKKLTVEKFVEGLLNSLISRHDEYKIIKQNDDYVDILSQKCKKKFLFRYHRCPMVFIDHYKSFEANVDRYEVTKAFYITWGRFEEKVYKHHKEGGVLGRNASYKICLIDGFNLARRILKLKRTFRSSDGEIDFLKVLKF